LWPAFVADLVAAAVAAGLEADATLAAKFSVPGKAAKLAVAAQCKQEHLHMPPSRPLQSLTC
jgi:hypothetical protein